MERGLSRENIFNKSKPAKLRTPPTSNPPLIHHEDQLKEKEHLLKKELKRHELKKKSESLSKFSKKFQSERGAENNKLSVVESEKGIYTGREMLILKKKQPEKPKEHVGINEPIFKRNLRRGAKPRPQNDNSILNQINTPKIYSKIQGPPPLSPQNMQPKLSSGIKSYQALCAQPYTPKMNQLNKQTLLNKQTSIKNMQKPKGDTETLPLLENKRKKTQILLGKNQPKSYLNNLSYYKGDLIEKGMPQILPQTPKIETRLRDFERNNPGERNIKIQNQKIENKDIKKSKIKIYVERTERKERERGELTREKTFQEQTKGAYFNFDNSNLINTGGSSASNPTMTPGGFHSRIIQRNKNSNTERTIEATTATTASTASTNYTSNPSGFDRERSKQFKNSSREKGNSGGYQNMKEMEVKPETSNKPRRKIANTPAIQTTRKKIETERSVLNSQSSGRSYSQPRNGKGSEQNLQEKELKQAGHNYNIVEKGQIAEKNFKAYRNQHVNQRIPMKELSGGIKEKINSPKMKKRIKKIDYMSQKEKIVIKNKIQAPVKTPVTKSKNSQQIIDTKGNKKNEKTTLPSIGDDIDESRNGNSRLLNKSQSLDYLFTEPLHKLGNQSKKQPHNLQPLQKIAPGMCQNPSVTTLDKYSLNNPRKQSQLNAKNLNIMSSFQQNPIPGHNLKTFKTFECMTPTSDAFNFPSHFGMNEFSDFGKLSCLKDEIDSQKSASRKLFHHMKYQSSSPSGMNDSRELPTTNSAEIKVVENQAVGETPQILQNRKANPTSRRGIKSEISKRKTQKSLQGSIAARPVGHIQPNLMKNNESSSISPRGDFTAFAAEAFKLSDSDKALNDVRLVVEECKELTAPSTDYLRTLSSGNSTFEKDMISGIIHKPKKPKNRLNTDLGSTKGSGSDDITQEFQNTGGTAKSSAIFSSSNSRPLYQKFREKKYKTISKNSSNPALLHGLQSQENKNEESYPDKVPIVKKPQALSSQQRNRFSEASAQLIPSMRIHSQDCQRHEKELFPFSTEERRKKNIWNGEEEDWEYDINFERDVEENERKKFSTIYENESEISAIAGSSVYPNSNYYKRAPNANPFERMKSIPIDEEDAMLFTKTLRNLDQLTHEDDPFRGSQIEFRDELNKKLGTLIQDGKSSKDMRETKKHRRMKSRIIEIDPQIDENERIIESEDEVDPVFLNQHHNSLLGGDKFAHELQCKLAQVCKNQIFNPGQTLTRTNKLDKKGSDSFYELPDSPSNLDTELDFYKEVKSSTGKIKLVKIVPEILSRQISHEPPKVIKKQKISFLENNEAQPILRQNRLEKKFNSLEKNLMKLAGKKNYKQLEENPSQKAFERLSSETSDDLNPQIPASLGKSNAFKYNSRQIEASKELSSDKNPFQINFDLLDEQMENKYFPDFEEDDESIENMDEGKTNLMKDLRINDDKLIQDRLSKLSEDKCTSESNSTSLVSLTQSMLQMADQFNTHSLENIKLFPKIEKETILQLKPSFYDVFFQIDDDINLSQYDFEFLKGQEVQ